MIQMQIRHLLSDIDYSIRLLYEISDPYSKTYILNKLWNQFYYLQFLIFSDAPHKVIQPRQNQQLLQNFTKEQLTQFNGRDGKPAYVAVNGTVYDVTNNAAWSLATHFGLTAGKDLTREFSSCHAGQEEIFKTLKVVGRVVLE